MIVWCILSNFCACALIEQALRRIGMVHAFKDRKKPVMEKASIKYGGKGNVTVKIPRFF